MEELTELIIEEFVVDGLVKMGVDKETLAKIKNLILDFTKKNILMAGQNEDGQIILFVIPTTITIETNGSEADMEKIKQFPLDAYLKKADELVLLAEQKKLND
jgi:hypothetical protein